MYEIKHYIAPDGLDVFMRWRSKVKDIKAKISIDRRIYRAELGNFGDHRPCREGVWELRIDVGSGYRLYYAQAGKYIILLICGGNKHSQSTDITKACEHWKDWQVRHAKPERPQ